MKCRLQTNPATACIYEGRIEKVEQHAEGIDSVLMTMCENYTFPVLNEATSYKAHPLH